MDTLIHFVHNTISLVYLLASLYIIVRSFIGWKQRKIWTPHLRLWSLVVLVAMYLQMAQGVYLFISQHYLNTGASLNKPSDLRFWPVEHFFLMFFALITTQLGYVITQNSKRDAAKYRALFTYYAVSLLMVIVSLVMILDFSRLMR